jgi:NitT/TauT family transport system substrate-binding protein
MTATPSLPFGRRRLLAATGAGVAAIGLAPAARGDRPTLRLVSPPGRPEGVSGYPYWVAKQLGYFGDLETTIDPGPPEATAAVKPVDRRQADLGMAAPDVLALGLEQGMRLVSVWQLGSVDPLALAFRKGEAAAGLQALAGATLLLDSAARQPVCDAWLAQAGLAPGAVAYVEVGPGWAQALAQGRGDAALAWEGLRAQWAGQGLGFDYLLGRAVSRFPGACLVARAQDLADPAMRPVLERYVRGLAMGLAFAERNPRAAAHIVTQQVPGLATMLPPPVATAALLQLAATYRGDMARRKGFGAHDADSWARLLRTLHDLGQISAKLGPADVVSDDLVAAANDFDPAQVQRDADATTLPPDFARVDVDALRAAP